jgi:hypothetical protein
MLRGAGKSKKFKISTVHAKIRSKSMMLGVARAPAGHPLSPPVSKKLFSSLKKKD